MNVLQQKEAEIEALRSQLKAKENARLRKELRDAQDALEILKKLSAYWEINRSSFP